METTAKFTVSLKDASGNPYNGEFVVKTLLSRRDAFRADEVRRQIVGPSPEGTPPAPQLQGEAYMMGQLAVRVLQAPDWWNNSDYGQNFPDGKIVEELFGLSVKKELDFKNELAKKAGAAAETLSKPKE